MLLLLVIVVLSFATYSFAADDFLSKHMRENARRHQIINRTSEMIEAVQELVEYTENPPKLVIKLNNADTITVTGEIARKAYEMAQAKKNLPAPEEVLEFMRQFINMDGQKTLPDKN